MREKEMPTTTPRVAPMRLEWFCAGAVLVMRKSI
jgi:hypothetical protein